MRLIEFLLLPIFFLVCSTETSFNISSNQTNENYYCFPENKTDCVDGIILKAWPPIKGRTTVDKAFRASVYLILMCYLFLGVSIISDRFMAAIEVITSQERVVKVKLRNGTTEHVNVRIWNETVSNLTLMALGSSAPEILLSIIEIIGKNFEAGELGPGTIVGSAAYNLFVIIGICVLIIPKGEAKKIKHLSVFLITGLWSIFAYLWLYLILAKISVGVVEIWEALLTFAFFPLTVFTAYVADTKIFFNKFLKRRFIRDKIKAFTQDGGDVEKKLSLSCGYNLEKRLNLESLQYIDDINDESNYLDFERHRFEFLDIIKEIRKAQPNISSRKLEELAQCEILKRSTKSRAFYRIQATRALTGTKSLVRISKEDLGLDNQLSELLENPRPAESDIQQLYFDPGHYTVFENEGAICVTVKRSGPHIKETFAEVDYYSEDGNATANEDYIPVMGKLIFQPGQSESNIYVTIIDDDVFEEDEHFFIHLKNLKVKRIPNIHLKQSEIISSQLSNPSSATIMILDDDHPGLFHFACPTITVTENIGFVEVKVLRSSGARGYVRIPFQTVDNTAIGEGRDYETLSGHLDFYNDQSECTINVKIIDYTEYEKNKSFFIKLGDPVLVDKSVQRKSSYPFNLVEDFSHRLSLRRRGSKAFCHNLNNNSRKNSTPSCKPQLEGTGQVEIIIRECQELKNVVDHLMKKSRIAQAFVTSSWKEQFKDALTISDENNDEEFMDENVPKITKKPSTATYIMHYLSLFWKLLFAFVPPTDICGGWLCFTVSIIVIGFLTAIVGDVASGFGCSVGLTDSVTAITFVAIGTSLPDTFASKVAALQDQTADSSIGNVMGSNAVNVYLGIGISWSIAACYHHSKGGSFRVSSGSLGFSVTLFCIMALIGMSIMLYRRKRSIGGELGGPKKSKYITASLFFSMWFLYILLSSLENYCHIPGF